MRRKLNSCYHNHSPLLILCFTTPYCISNGDLHKNNNTVSFNTLLLKNLSCRARISLFHLFHRVRVISQGAFCIGSAMRTVILTVKNHDRLIVPENPAMR